MKFQVVSDAVLADLPTRLGLWFGFLGGGVAWTLHLLLSYFVAEFGCEAGLDRHVYLGIMLPAWLLMGVSLFTTLLGAAAVFVAWRLKRRFQALPGDPEADGADRFLARTGFLTSLLFTAIIVAQSLPILFYLGSC
jgi:hypothetical protein